MRTRLVTLVLIVVLTGMASPVLAADRVGRSKQSIEWQGVSELDQQVAPSFELTGMVQRPGFFTVEKLRNYPAVGVEVASGQDRPEERVFFTGALLWDIIRDAGPLTQGGRKNDLLRKYLVITGHDGYQVVISLPEILPDFGGQRVIVAFERDPQPIGQGSGKVRLIVPGDKRRGRHVNQIIRIVVRDAEP